MTLDPQTIQHFKERLLLEKKHLEEELGEIATPGAAAGDYATNFNEIGPDEDENASEVEEYADNLALEVNLQKQLKETSLALERIEKGTYGKCENCDADISLERLEAYPSARTCIKC
jgi:DnaK suppressor protein